MPLRQLKSGISIKQIAAETGAEIVGSANITVSGVCPLDAPTADGIAFSGNTHPKQLRQALTRTPRPAAIFISKSFPRAELPEGVVYLLVPNPQLALIKIIPLFFEPYTPEQGISANADIHPTAVIGEGVKIGPFVSVGPGVRIGSKTVVHSHVAIYGGAEIGSDCIIHSGAVIREECRVGSGTIVQNGVVLGADGFGYIPDDKGELLAVPQIGNVVIGDRVEIGANSCVDRATLGVTQIGNGTKIDNLVQIGHNGRIGDNVIICGMSGLAGSVTVGDSSVIGASSGVKDHVSIGSRIRIGARSGVIKDLSTPGDYAGFPAVPARQWRREMAALARLAQSSKISEKESDEADSK